MHHPEPTALDLRAEGKLDFNSFCEVFANQEVVFKMHVVKAIAKAVYCGLFIFTPAT